LGACANLNISTQQKLQLYLKHYIHPTSCSSIGEILSVLFFHTMRYKVSAPRDPSSDRFVLSKGHAAPALYAAWAEAGLFSISDLQNLRKFKSDLEGHPTPRLNFIDVGTGSLGQGLAIAGGMAYVGKYFDKASYRVYCLIGDGESAEGSIWESVHFASYYKLDNLCIIIDVNRLGQSQETSIGHDVESYRKKMEAFGTEAIIVDGHDVEELVKAFHSASATKGKPTAIIAKTLKGKNFPKIENLENWHGKPLGVESDVVVNHLKGLLQNPGPLQVHPQKPLKEDAPTVDITNIRLSSPPNYKLGDQIATRVAYGTALVKIAQNNPRVIALDGDMKNSTFSEKLLHYDVGKANVVLSSPKDQVVLIGAGVTLQESLSAAKELAQAGIGARVIDPFTVKPLDKETIIKNIKDVGGRAVVTEDHYYQGGLGEAVIAALAMEKDIIVKHLAVGELPRSGPPNALLQYYGISAKHISSAAQDILKL
ncbi:hypothetical protein D910_11513, partial [Dendroctonus ponderosae]